MRIEDLVDDQRWVLDDPSAAEWFSVALGLTWTRDPFDRLLAAHARYRGWKLATGDGHLVAELGPDSVVEL
jgi:PIN domain nuclease of toxin-antitoxin system